MPAAKKSAAGTRYRALRDLALRRSPDPASAEYEQWYEWPAGTVFEAPAHLRADVAIASGKIEEVADG